MEQQRGHIRLLIIDMWQVGCNVMHIAQTIHCRGRCRRESELVLDTPTASQEICIVSIQFTLGRATTVIDTADT